MILLSLWRGELWSQVTISGLNFEGFKKTKPDFLQHFLQQTKGVILDTNQVKKDLVMLRNLDLFYELDQKVEITDSEIEITYSGLEKKSVLPIINFGGIRENFWIQLGAFDGHFRGRGELFGAYYTYYDRSSFNVFYKKPFIGDSKFGLELILQKLSTREPVQFNGNSAIYDYDNYTIEILGVRWFNLRNRLKLGIAYLDELYNKFSEPEFNAELPDNVNHQKWIFKSKYEWGQLNYYTNLLEGIDNHTFFEVVFSEQNDFFWKFLNQTRLFKKWGNRHNLAARLRFGISKQVNSPFVPFVLDSYINIRGSGNRVARGTGEIVANLEYRYNIKETSWGVYQAVLFMDIGGWRPINQGFGEAFTRENATSFMGFGGRLHFKKIYNLTLRADLGIKISDPSENGLVLGLGQYF